MTKREIATRVIELAEQYAEKHCVSKTHSIRDRDGNLHAIYDVDDFHAAMWKLAHDVEFA